MRGPFPSSQIHRDTCDSAPGVPIQQCVEILDEGIKDSEPKRCEAAGERESGRVGEWESRRAGERESGRAGEWESASEPSIMIHELGLLTTAANLKVDTSRPPSLSSRPSLCSISLVILLNGIVNIPLAYYTKSKRRKRRGMGRSVNCICLAITRGGEVNARLLSVCVHLLPRLWCSETIWTKPSTIITLANACTLGVPPTAGTGGNEGVKAGDDLPDRYHYIGS